MPQTAPALLADVGGTHTRCAVSDGQALSSVRVFDNNDYTSLEVLLAEYVQEEHQQLTLSEAILGVAGLVQDDQVTLLNRDWSFSSSSISTACAVTHTRLVNDFEALAYAVPNLQPSEVEQCGGTNTQEFATRSVLGPGTGLGVSNAVWTGRRWLALPGEGGHVTLAATNEVEAGLCRYLRERFGRGSAERALCGPGLSHIHDYLHHEQLQSREISAQAHAGDTAAKATFNLFFGMLASFAGDLVLTVGATGGVYLAGGVIAKNRALIDSTEFRRRFENKGRYAEFLHKIPVFWVTSSVPALTGLAYLHRRPG